MRTLAITNQKGGTGKTTLAVSLGVALAARGKRVLLIDLDPQASLTYALGITPELTILDYLQETTPEIPTVTREGVDILPGSENMAGLEVSLGHQTGREHVLKNRLATGNPYDYAFIDCPPSISILTANALTAADQVLIPLQAEVLSYRGLSQLLPSIKRVQAYTNPSLKVRGIVASLFDGRRRLSGEVLTEIRARKSLPVFKTCIRICVKIAEAPSFGKSIFAYAPRSNGATDYTALATEFLESEV